MSGPRFALEQIEIPIPCAVPWAAMTGDERVRVCGECNKAVHQLKNYTRDEAERLLGSAPGEVCVQLYRRPDGTVLTADCTPPSRGVGAVLNGVFATLGAGLALLGIGLMKTPNANSTFSFVGGGVRPPSSYSSDTPPAPRPTPVYAEPGPVPLAPPPREK